jgi:DNA-binding NarL/FixJ family response regulator
MGAAAGRSYDGNVLDEVHSTLPAAGLENLTPRELEVLGMIANGMTNAEAARQLNLSVHAIKFHLAAVYRRLGVTNRTEAAPRGGARAVRP